MLDKTILVFYIAVRNMPYEDRHTHFERVRDNIVNSTNIEDNEKMIRYFVPLEEGESRIECINSPTYINNEEVYKKLLKQIDEIDKTLDKVTSRLTPLTRKVLVEKTIK
jgi:hypothetical protein